MRREDPRKIVTMRTPETQKRYDGAIALKKHQAVTGCPLCSIPEDERFPALTFWRIVRNEYPYDRVAEECWIFMPRRCVPVWASLTPEEQREYHAFRLVAGHHGINFFMWSTPTTQSVPGHYHEHLLRLHRMP